MQYFVDAADRQSGEIGSALSATNDAHGTSPLAREQHHILFYKLVAGTTSSDYYVSASPTTPTYSALTVSWTSGHHRNGGIACPQMTAAATNIATENTWGTTGTAETTSRTGEHFAVDYAQPDANSLDTYRYVVAQAARPRGERVGVLGRFCGCRLTSSIRRPVTVDLDLHPTSDTGSRNGTDQETSSVSRRFSGQRGGQVRRRMLTTTRCG